MKTNLIICVVGILVLVGGMTLMVSEELSMALNILGAFIAAIGFCIVQFFPENPRWFSILQCIAAFWFMAGFYLGIRVFHEDQASLFSIIGGAVLPVAIASWGQMKGFKTKRRLFDKP